MQDLMERVMNTETPVIAPPCGGRRVGMGAAERLPLVRAELLRVSRRVGGEVIIEAGAFRSLLGLIEDGL